MARKLQLSNHADMTGGLNLRSDPFQLAPNESPDLLNVDVDPRGGFVLRKSVAPFSATTFASDINSIWDFSSSGGTKQVMVASGGKTYYSTGGAFTAVQISAVDDVRTTGKVRAATFKDRVYSQNGVEAARRWNGAAAVVVGTAFNDDLTTPTPDGSTGNMPIAKCIAAHQGFMWVANTTESAVPFANRVRFSHPNFPEDWRTLDYIDVDTGADGDVITALVPFGDRLLVFKANSIHAIYGFDADTFQVYPVTRDAGTMSQESVVATEQGVYFFSWPKGVFLYQGRDIEWLFERLLPAIQDGTIPGGESGDIALGWFNRRLYVATPYGNTTTNNRVLVFDSTLGKKGGWTAYDLRIGAFNVWDPPASDAQLLGTYAATAGNRVVLKLNQSAVTDDVGGGATHITSYYITRWIDLSQPAIVKRWKRPQVVLRGGANATVSVEAFGDYDPTDVMGSFFLHTTQTRPSSDPNLRTLSNALDTPSLPAVLIWDAGQWDVNVWDVGGAGGGDNSGTVYNVVKRGTPLGSARAVRLKFTGPDTNVIWGVDAYTLPFLPKRVRS